MKSKVLLAVAFLAVISTICVSQEKQSQDAKENSAKAELERLMKMPPMEREEQRRILSLSDEVRSLVGAKGVIVFIDDLNKHATSMGLTKDQLKTDAELKLRQAGIKISSNEEWFSSKDMSYLYINVAPNGDDSRSGTVYNVSVQHRQRVKMLRSPFAEFLAITWKISWQGNCPSSCSKSKFQQEARQSVMDKVNVFIEDYLTANPKK